MGRTKLSKIVTLISFSTFIMMFFMNGLSFGLTRLKWTNYFDGNGTYANAITVDSSGNIYVTGPRGQSPFGDFFTIKYSNNGHKAWTNQYNSGNDDDAYAIAIDSSKNLYITGYANNGANKDFCTIKLNSAGIFQWQKTFNRGGLDEAYGVAVDPGGNVYVAGYSHNGSDYDYCVIKYDPSGNAKWTNFYNSGNSDYAKGIAVDSHSNFYVTGRRVKGAGYEYFTIKYLNNRTIAWSNKYYKNDNENVAGIALDRTGNVYVAGDSYNVANNRDFITIKYSPSGVAIKTNIYDGGKDEYPNGIAIDSLGNVYEAGYTVGTDADYFIIKYDSMGNLQWTNQYDRGLDTAYGIAVNTNDNTVFVTGMNKGPLMPDPTLWFTYGIPPKQPSDFKGVAISTNMIRWSWIDNASDENGYQLQDASSSVILSIFKNTTICTEFNVSFNPNQKAIRHVTVTNSLGNVDSANATNYTLSLPCKYLVCTNTNIGSFDLLAGTNRGGSYGFVLQRSTSKNGSYVTRYTNFSSTLVSFSLVNDSGLAAGTVYWYRLAALNGSKEYSSWITNSFKTKNSGGQEPVVEYIKVTNTSGGTYYRGDISIKAKVNDADGDNIKYLFYYNSDSLGLSWNQATIKENIDNKTQGVEYTFTWDSAKDIIGKNATDVLLKLRPYDGSLNGEEMTISSAIIINNVQLENKSDVRVRNSFESMNKSDSTEIMLSAESTGEIVITIYDSRGRKVREIKQTVLAGFNSIPWDYKDSSNKQVASDIYTLWVKGAGVDKYVKIAVYR